MTTEPFWADEVPPEENPVLAYLQREPGRWAVVKKDLGFMEAVMFQTHLKQSDSRIETKVRGVTSLTVLARIKLEDPKPPGHEMVIGIAEEDISAGMSCVLVIDPQTGASTVRRYRK